jgi:hypothetical protein
MYCNWKEPVPEYKDVKKKTFAKYHRKIDAIIQNINSNSLSDNDKKKLFREIRDRFNNQYLSK